MISTTIFKNIRMPIWYIYEIYMCMYAYMYIYYVYICYIYIYIYIIFTPKCCLFRDIVVTSDRIMILPLNIFVLIFENKVLA